MIKKTLLILILSLVCVPVLSEPLDNGGYAGFPPGFYDDIDPATLDNDDDELYTHPGLPNREIQNNTTQQDIHTLNDDDEIFIGQPVKTKATKNYAQIYKDLEPADFSYLHDIDPDQYYDMKDSAWSVYPLLRLNSPIYFKNSTIEPGYYLLTPREHNGKWYLLFKQNGVVAHIIPVYDRDYTPEKFYEEHIPQPKLTRAQKIHMGFLNFIGDKIDSSKRKEPIKSFLEVNDLENYFVSIVIYYGGHKYSTIFRTIRL
ncbi:hypothetical protein IJ750_04340 [bacterium]|nr:hypothetical protein [bacterium]